MTSGGLLLAYTKLGVKKTLHFEISTLRETSDVRMNGVKSSSQQN